MAEQPYTQGGQVRPRSDSEVSGTLMRGFGDITEYYTYKPIFKEYKFINFYRDNEGKIMQDQATGAYFADGEPYTHKYLEDIRPEKKYLPIKNFFSIGLTTSIMPEEHRTASREILAEVADQIERLILNMELGNTQAPIEITAYMQKLYVLLASLADTSKASGELAYLAKTEIGVNRTDFLQRQELFEEKQKGGFGKVLEGLSHKGGKKKTLDNWGR